MTKENFLNTLVTIIATVILTGIAGYFIYSQKQGVVATTVHISTPNTSPNTQLSKTPLSATPSLSADKKSIVIDDKVLLVVDNDIIFNWFKAESQLCDSYNISSTADRKSFCEDKTSFKKITRFSSIVISPDEMKIGFTLESDTLSPDTVAGVFLRSSNKVNLLSNYYLGNEFISFSSNGTNFVFSSYCFEDDCGFTVKNSDTLSDQISFGNTTDHSDYRFVRWLSENKIEYKDGTELKRKSF